MGKSRAEYMRDYRQRRFLEDLKNEMKEKLKENAHNLTQRSRDFRARAANSTVSQTSTTLPHLVVSHVTSRLPSLPSSMSDVTHHMGLLGVSGHELKPEQMDIFIRYISQTLLGSAKDIDNDFLKESQQWALDSTQRETLWKNLRTQTESSMQKLLENGDCPECNLSDTLWQCFDYYMVHNMPLYQKLFGSCGDNPIQMKAMIHLYNLVGKHRVEYLRDAPVEVRIKCWINVGLDYMKKGHVCSLMHLQRRWHEMKMCARMYFLEYWSVFRRIRENKVGQETLRRPNYLHINIAVQYPHVMLKELQSWTRSRKYGGVITMEQFENDEAYKQMKETFKAIRKTVISSKDVVKGRQNTMAVDASNSGTDTSIIQTQGRTSLLKIAPKSELIVIPISKTSDENKKGEDDDVVMIDDDLPIKPCDDLRGIVIENIISSGDKTIKLNKREGKAMTENEHYVSVETVVKSVNQDQKTTENGGPQDEKNDNIIENTSVNVIQNYSNSAETVVKSEEQDQITIENDGPQDINIEENFTQPEEIYEEPTVSSITPPVLAVKREPEEVNDLQAKRMKLSDKYDNETNENRDTLEEPVEYDADFLNSWEREHNKLASDGEAGENKIHEDNCFVFEMSEDITQRSAQNSKNYRERKKSATKGVVKKKTNFEYCKMYRQPKKLLAQELQSENEVLHTSSTSSLQMTFEPQPITTGENAEDVERIDNDIEIIEQKRETIVIDDEIESCKWNYITKMEKITKKVYGPLAVYKNPDFNQSLQRFTASFMLIPRNRSLLNQCKPCTIDLVNYQAIPGPRNIIPETDNVRPSGSGMINNLPQEVTVKQEKISPENNYIIELGKSVMHLRQSKFGLMTVTYPAAKRIIDRIPKLAPKPLPKITPKPSEQIVPKPLRQIVPKPLQQIVPKPSQEITPNTYVIMKPSTCVKKRNEILAMRPKLAPKPLPKITPKPSQQIVPKPSQQIVPKPSQQILPKPSQEITPNTYVIMKPSTCVKKRNEILAMRVDSNGQPFMRSTETKNMRPPVSLPIIKKVITPTIPWWYQSPNTERDLDETTLEIETLEEILESLSEKTDKICKPKPLTIPTNADSNESMATVLLGPSLVKPVYKSVVLVPVRSEIVETTVRNSELQPVASNTAAGNLDLSTKCVQTRLDEELNSDDGIVVTSDYNTDVTSDYITSDKEFMPKSKQKNNETHSKKIQNLKFPSFPTKQDFESSIPCHLVQNLQLENMIPNRSSVDI